MVNQGFSLKPLSVLGNLTHAARCQLCSGTSLAEKFRSVFTLTQLQPGTFHVSTWDRFSFWPESEPIPKKQLLNIGVNLFKSGSLFL